MRHGTDQFIDLAADRLTLVDVQAMVAELDGSQGLKVTKNPAVEAFDEPTFAKLTDTNFHNGTIKVKVLGQLLPDAPEYARGFIGVAFRINESNTQFEAFYIRPTNARSEDQMRRNRVVQYISFPDYKFDRLRVESPGVYEAYADIGLDEWIDLTIEVLDDHAQLYVNHASQPTLVVKDLKNGATNGGAIGLWVDVGTAGYFEDLQIIPR
ncbi:hypothetical protein FC50_GL002094 [Lacticaseibacillus pantheris DSM 15945 = JCM 12539 = NBRC 106106]|jgi:hypothetical protein|uniref:3-keto-disaccharide hydrolase domain-containing protein n=1 Tax=Lacticaseibacillus pantheris DSM 15945 = JCM 12539 = NBRC 106106 TaxID=1423783 RepID=A0A0R1TZZ5_9LACO|nr:MULTISPECIES: hypothetical protein [Lacticaseibacillus]KRL84483.1 hypothetical protein FC50_GL002094 [Lacticaseibacillus pantheris DSM 15945 = JCM 12539 = NBRC 106106]